MSFITNFLKYLLIIAIIVARWLTGEPFKNDSRAYIYNVCRLKQMAFALELCVLRDHNINDYIYASTINLL